jgi:hypothetical protein
VAEIVKLPRLGGREPAANHILIDEDFNGTETQRLSGNYDRQQESIPALPSHGLDGSSL